MSDIYFHRTDRDRQPARRVITAQLLGDPDPNREARSEALLAKIRPPHRQVGTRGPAMSYRKYVKL